MKGKILFLALAFFLSLASVQAALTDGLEGSWSFDQSSGTTATEYSGNARDMTISAASMWTTAGRINNAVNFSRADGHQGSATYNPDPLSAWTWMGWVWIDRNYTSGSLTVFSHGEDAGNSRRDFGLFDGKWQACVRDTSGCIGTGDGALAPVQAGHIGNWTLVGIVANRTAGTSYVQIYLNGAGSTMVTGSNNFGNANNQFVIGGGLGAFNGTIDEVNYWNRSLSSTEIASLMIPKNFSIMNDTIAPTLNITSPLNGSTVTSQTNIFLAFNATDNVGNLTCFFNVTRGASLEIGHTQVGNCANFTFSVTSDAQYVAHVIATDSASNAIYRNSTFTVNAVAGASSGGGGGGGGGGRSVIEVLTRGSNMTSICVPYKPTFDDAYKKFKESGFSGDTFNAFWYAFWDYALCESAASIVRGL